MCRVSWLRKVSVHPISAIVSLWLLWVLGPVVALNYFFAIAIHELGHFILAEKLGYTLSKFSFSPYGISLSYFNEDFNEKDEVKIAAAGPVANFVSAFFIMALWWIFPSTYFFTESFVYVSVLLALVNLFPAYPLDGGRIFLSISSKIFTSKTAKKITVCLNIVLSAVFCLLFCFSCMKNFNPSYLLFSIFLVVGCLEFNQNSKYEKLSIYKKKTINFQKIEHLFVDQDTTLCEILKKITTKKLCIFCLVLQNGKIINLSEKMILNLSTKFSINTKLSEIFNNI